MTKNKTTEIELETTLFKSIVKALVYHTRAKDVREMLTVIHFGKTEMVATNAHTLAVWEPRKTWGPTFVEPFQIDAKALLNGIKDMKGDTIKLKVAGQEWLVTEGRTKSNGGSTVEGAFPNWKQVIPSEINNKFEPTGFDPALIKRICDASLSINKDTPLKVAVWQTPTKPMLFRTETMDGVLTQLVMPQRLTNKK